MKKRLLLRVFNRFLVALLSLVFLFPPHTISQTNSTSPSIPYFTDANAFIHFLASEHFRNPFQNDSEYFKFVTSNAKQFQSLTPQEELEINYTIAYQYLVRSGTYAAYPYIDRLNTLISNPQNHHLKHTSEAFTLLGTYFYSFDRINEAKFALNKALKTTPESYKKTIDTYNTLGLIAQKENQLDTTLFYYNKALKLATEKHDEAWIGIISGNIGYVQYLKKNYRVAKKLLQDDFQSGVKTKQIESAIGSGTFLIQIALEENNLAVIPYYFKILDSLIQYTRDPASNMSYHLSKALYLEKIGQYKEALFYKDKYIAYRDTANNRYNQVNLQNTIFQIEFEKQKATDLIAQEKTKHRNILYNIIITVLILVLTSLLVVFLLWRKNKNREQKILQLRHENTQILFEKHRQELKHVLNNIMKQNDVIQNLRSEIDTHKNSNLPEEIREKFQNQIESLTLITENDLFEFSELFQKIHPEFTSKLTGEFPDLTSAEIRLAMIIRLKLDRQAAAKVLCVTEESVRKNIFRLRKKLNINSIEGLYQFIANF